MALAIISRCIARHVRLSHVQLHGAVGRQRWLRAVDRSLPEADRHCPRSTHPCTHPHLIHTSPHPPIHTSTCTKGHQVVRCSVDAQARARQHLWRAGLRKRSRCVSHLLSDRDRGYSFGGMTLVSVFNLRTSTGSKLPVSTTRSSSCHPTGNHRLYQSVVASRTSQPSRSSCNYRSSIVCHSV